MREATKILSFVIGFETECKTFVETQLEEHNKRLKKNLARLQKRHRKTCVPVTPKGHKKSFLFFAGTTPNATENMQACEK